MEKATVLFFAADPVSAPPHGHGARLLLDDEVREIKLKVRTARYRDDLDFDEHWATRTDDLLLALNETAPQVVHFSGHGGTGGLVLVGADASRPHSVDAGALVRLFRVFRGDIRVVVLNACFSLPQAEAIADVVGCAIGTRTEISDRAAIVFSSSFYRAIAFGHSVGAAFEQARLALDLDLLKDRDCVELVIAPGVDPAQLFVIPPGGLNAGERRTGEGQAGRTDAGWRATTRPARARMTGGGLALVGAAAIAWKLLTAQPPCAWAGEPHPVTQPGSSGGPSELDRAKVAYQAGQYAEAFSRFRKVAQRGDPEAIGFVGAMFLHGQGIGERPDSGIHWLRVAAGKGDVRGMTELASAYLNGDGVRRSRYWAQHWLHKAANNKHSADAMRRLGSFYLAEQNYGTALTWFANAVKAGSLDALIDAGQMYEQGQGTSRNLEEAVCLYRKAAEAGSPSGMFHMGRVHENGIGVDRDYEEAAEWYWNAAEKGLPGGMRALGELYLDGRGVPRDTARAKGWFRNAEAAGRRAETIDLAAAGAT
ncbi:MAG TPA: CHAT domain-containing protein [Longimicrobiaceae bacterium]|jgi:TPR repeat protein